MIIHGNRKIVTTKINLNAGMSFLFMCEMIKCHHDRASSRVCREQHTHCACEEEMAQHVMIIFCYQEQYVLKDFKKIISM